MTVFILIFATFATACLSLVGGILFLGKSRLAQKIQTAGPLIAAVVLLWAAFGDIIPEILEDYSLETPEMLRYIIIGIIICTILGFVLGHFHHHADLSSAHTRKSPAHTRREKTTGIRHVNLKESSKHTRPQKSPRHLAESKVMLIVDTIHNFADGLVLGASFAASPVVGLSACAATIAHEIPQEIADFSVMQKAKLPRSKIIKYQFLSSLAIIPAALLSFIFSDLFRDALPRLLSLIAGFLIYLAIAEILSTIELVKSRLPKQLKV